MISLTCQVALCSQVVAELKSRKMCPNLLKYPQGDVDRILLRRYEMLYNCVTITIFYFLSLGLPQCKSKENSADLWKLMTEEQSAGKVIGANPGFFPKSAKFYNGNLGITLDKDLLANPNENIEKESQVFGGSGIRIKASKYPIAVDISPPSTKENACGLILSSSNTNNVINKLRLLWKYKPLVPWDLLAVPNTGEYFFNFADTVRRDTRVLLFDQVPVSTLRILIHATDNEGLNLTMALIYGCQYEGNIRVECDEVADQNTKFANLKFGVPTSISCPANCVKTKSCTGYKVYSSDSPICSVAEQALGSNGDGNFFLYKIPKVAVFRDQIVPLLNNRIYCRRSTQESPGITFSRLYYDFSVKEYQKLKSG